MGNGYDAKRVNVIRAKVAEPSISFVVFSFVERKT
jgi:hypothetical protein